ncbi:MAG: peptidoglycan DD-metalloendopeptidase family protein [Deltaproteobacteria bacterium]|nr:peptidoglycan DD-metalloendopeptidase family protein [Deltaproteobacteria bacterium]
MVSAGSWYGPVRTVAIVLAVLVAGSAGAYAGRPGPDDRNRPSGATGGRAARESRGARDFEHMVNELEDQEQRLRRELEELRPKIDTAHRRMIARGRAYYRLVRAGLLPVGGGFDALVDHATTVERLRAALVRDVVLLRKLEDRQAEAKRQLRRATAEKAPLMVQQEAMRRAGVAIREAEERRAAFLRAFGGASDGTPHLAIYGAGTGPVTGEPLVRFSQMKGRLSFPLAGRFEVLTPHQPSEEGLQLVAARDSAVRAVYAGRVAFAGKTDHGETVVLEHGDGYYSVYGGLQRTEVRVKEQLLERERLGWVLRTATRRPTLYFELRRGRRLLDPAPWLGL